SYHGSDGEGCGRNSSGCRWIRTYQKYLCFAVVGVISGLCSLTFATQLFSLVTPDHWCWNPELAALARQLPLPQEDTKKFSIPLVKGYFSVASVPEFCPAGVLLYANKSTNMSLSHLSTFKCHQPGPGSNPQPRAQKASAIPTTLPRRLCSLLWSNPDLCIELSNVIGSQGSMKGDVGQGRKRTMKTTGNEDKFVVLSSLRRRTSTAYDLQNYLSIRRAQLVKFTLLTSTLGPPGIYSDAKERVVCEKQREATALILPKKTCKYRKNDAKIDQKEKNELVGSLTEKKLPTEGCTGRNERPLPWGEVESASYSQCQRFGGDLVGAYIGWVAAKRPHSHTPVTPGSGRPYPVRGCDQGWAYNHTFHTLTTENNWVCDSKWKPYAVHTAFWLGASLVLMFVDIWPKVTNYNDDVVQFGRRLTLLLGMLINVIGGVATLVSSGFILLMLSRFVAGLGHLTVNYLALFLVLELCDEEHRVIPLLVMIAAYTTGSLTAPWVARAVVSWWWLTLIITLLSGIVCFTLSWQDLRQPYNIFSYRIIPESPWWMLTKGHHKDAVQLLQRIAKVNGKAPWKINQKLLEESCDFWTVNCGRQQICCLRSNSDSKNDLFDLKKIRCNSCRKQFIILNAIWILCSSCYFGKHYISLNLLATAFNTRSDPSSDFTSYWYSALIEIPIWILPFILQGSPKMSQAALILSLTSAASLGIAHALLPTGNIVTSVTTGLIDRLVVTVAYYTMLQRRWDVSIADRITSVTMEISTGLAVSTVPAVIFVGEYYHQMPSLWFGTVASVAAVLSFFLPVSIESAGDQLTRRKDSVQWLRRCLQSTQLR
ncbi:hypothetical protein ANN_21994, partial [Periplaneta americana]